MQTTYQYKNTYPVTLDASLLATPEVFIDLNNKQRASIVKLVSLRENCFFAGIVDKVNKRQSVQKRVLMITDKALYNIDHDVSFFETLTLCHSFDGYRIRRKINVNNIYGATICVNPASTKQQVLVHVQNEYDYLYNAGQKRDQIVKSLMNAHFATTKNIPFVLFCREETNFSKFHTSESDVKKKKDRRPKEGQILVTREMIQNGLDWIIYNRNLLSNTANNGSNSPQNQSQGYGGNSPNVGPNNGPNRYPQMPGPNGGTVQQNQAQLEGLNANLNPFQQVMNQNQQQNQVNYAPNPNQPHLFSNNSGGNQPNAYGNVGGQNLSGAPDNSKPTQQFMSIYPSLDNHGGGQWS